MQTNTRNAFELWKKGKQSPPSTRHLSIWTDGLSIWSYATCIATRHFERPDGALVVILNDSDYSVTTRRHQNSLDIALDAYSQRIGATYERVTGIARDADALSLRQAYFRKLDSLDDKQLFLMQSDHTN